MKKRRTLILVVVGVLACVGVVFVVPRLLPASSSATTNVQTGRVSRATLSAVVESSGSVTAEADATLNFDAAGTISAVKVKVGDVVKQGDVLAELDTRDIELQIAQQTQSYLSQQASYSMTITPDPAAVKSAQIALDNANAAYKLAKQKYAVNSTDSVSLSCDNVDNAKQTYDDAVNAYNALLTNWRVVVNGSFEISPQKAQLDRAKAAYDQALASCALTKNGVNTTGIQSALMQVQQAKTNLDNLVSPSERTLTLAKVQLDQAKLALDQATRQLADARIIAPFDGLVTKVSGIVGGASSAASITLVDAGRYHVDVLVDETEIAQVQLGQQAELTFDALPKAKVTGTVKRIDPAGTVSQGVVNYKVRVDLDKTEAALRIDMSANVRVILDTHSNVLAVPGGAIRSDTTTGGYYVNVVDTTGEAKRVDVTTGYTDGDLTEVSGDLQQGDQVYTSEPPAAQAQGGFGLFGVRAVGR